MPQGRILLKRISNSKKMPQLKTDGARLLYSWLIPHVDINGCFSADPEVVKGKVFTKLRKSTRTIAKYLEDLANIGLIVIYEVDSEIFLCIPNHTERQPSLNPNREAKPTVLPPTPEQLQSNSRQTPLKVKESKVKESKYTDSFETFWRLFKGRWKPKEGEFGKYEKGSKAEAFAEWEKLSLADQQKAVKGAPHSGGEFTQDCCRWLKGKRWER